MAPPGLRSLEPLPSNDTEPPSTGEDGVNMNAATGGDSSASVVPTAPTAFSRPWPAASDPADPTALAVDLSALSTWSTVATGSDWSSSAASAAACGAASDVPKKRQTPPIIWSKNVVAAPSVAATSGLDTTSGLGRAAAGVVPLTGP